jgi:hypothetical protein
MSRRSAACAACSRFDADPQPDWLQAPARQPRLRCDYWRDGATRAADYYCGAEWPILANLNFVAGA